MTDPDLTRGRELLAAAHNLPVEGYARANARDRLRQWVDAHLPALLDAAEDIARIRSSAAASLLEERDTLRAENARLTAILDSARGRANTMTSIASKAQTERDQARAEITRLTDELAAERGVLADVYDKNVRGAHEEVRLRDELATLRARVIEECAQAVEGFRRPLPYLSNSYNGTLISNSNALIDRAAAAVRALDVAEQNARGET